MTQRPVAWPGVFREDDDIKPPPSEVRSAPLPNAPPPLSASSPPLNNLPYAALRPTPAVAAPVPAPAVAPTHIEDDKFKQLLTDFQKLKSNNAILKKAVLQVRL